MLVFRRFFPSTIALIVSRNVFLRNGLGRLQRGNIAPDSINFMSAASLPFEGTEAFASHASPPKWQRAAQPSRRCKLRANLYTHLNRNEFMSHYHQRSNVERTFRMVKRKVGNPTCWTEPQEV